MPELQEFRVTFGTSHTNQPGFPAAHPDGWLTIVAPDYTAARALVVSRLGPRWSGLTEAEGFVGDDGAGHVYYPLGELGRWTTTGGEA